MTISKRGLGALLLSLALSTGCSTTGSSEAAMLGVPVYSVFMGRIGTIDQRLSDEGRLHMLRTVEDAEHVRLEKRPSGDPTAQPDHRKHHRQGA